MIKDCSNCFWGDSRLSKHPHCDYLENDEDGQCEGWDYEQNYELKETKGKE